MNYQKYYSAKDIAKYFRRDPHTIRDWINHGCPTSGGRVKLNAIKLGKSWMIKAEWLAVFELQCRDDTGRPDLSIN